MMRYAVVIEKAGDTYSAYSPDVDGCIAAADTVEETLTLYQAALRDHFTVMFERGEALPHPATDVAYVDVEAPTLALTR